MTYIIEGESALVNEHDEETPLKAGDFVLVNPDEKHQYRNKVDCLPAITQKSNPLILLFNRKDLRIELNGCNTRNVHGQSKHP